MNTNTLASIEQAPVIHNPAPAATDVMLDLETMGSGSTAAIIAIGAVAFNRDTGFIDMDNPFYQTVSLQSCIDAGLSIDGGTVMWWCGRSDEARKGITEGEPLSLIEALMALRTWLMPYNRPFLVDKIPGNRSVRVWGNGADFDNPILSNAYRATGIEQPWGVFRGRCYRTKKDDFRHITLERYGVHHNAIDDAISQARHLCEIYTEFNHLKTLGARVALCADSEA